MHTPAAKTGINPHAPTMRLAYTPHVGDEIMRSSNCTTGFAPRSTFMHTLSVWLFSLFAAAAGEALAGGLSSSVLPGARDISGKISEWPVPTHKYARDPAVGPDGNIYFAVRAGDKIARFEPKAKRFQEWGIPAGMQPRGLVVARDGKVLFGGAGNGAIGELDPTTGKTRIYKIPSGDSDPYTLVFDAADNIWFTERKAGRLAKFDRASGTITEYPIGENPYALSVDKRGIIWVTRREADRLVRFDPKTLQTTELSTGKGSQPRRTALAPNGKLWVTLYGTGKLAKIDTAANRVAKEYTLPGGPNAGPYAVNVDADGRVWVSEIQTDNVVILDPRNDAIRVIKLPTKDTGVRKAAIDADGRYWYVGSHAGKLGVIE
jgi:virginiamycin B lyase